MEHFECTGEWRIVKKIINQRKTLELCVISIVFTWNYLIMFNYSTHRQWADARYESWMVDRDDPTWCWEIPRTTRQVPVGAPRALREGPAWMECRISRKLCRKPSQRGSAASRAHNLEQTNQFRFEFVMSVTAMTKNGGVNAIIAGNYKK